MLTPVNPGNLRDVCRDRKTVIAGILGTMKRYFAYLPLLFLVAVTCYLRLANLGYSNYIADEVLALIILKPGQSFMDFILNKPRGPVQYVLTYLIGLFQPGYPNPLLTRLPFALIGILGIFLFYLLVRRHFGGRAALYATLFLSTDGLLVGLNRVVQYQPLVILFSLLALYGFTLAVQEPRWRMTGLYLGMFSWALAILTHYDGIFIAPFAAYLLLLWYRQNAELPVSTRLMRIFLPGALAALLVAAYYAPLLLSIWGDKQSYWAERLTPELESRLPSSSLVIFQIYNPLLAVYLYPLVGAFSLLNLRRSLPVWLWFLFPWLILEGVVYDPGTHIYNYIIPATALMGLGAVALEERLARWSRRVLKTSRGFELLVPAGLGASLLLFTVIAQFLYVDHTPEYPREARRFLLWTFTLPQQDYRLWLYGFPYNRSWTQIGDYLVSHGSNGYFATNEDKDIAGYYVHDTFDIDQAGYFVQISRPQSFRDQLANEKIRYWLKNYKPVKVFQLAGRVMAEIYQMPSGTLDQIRAEGY
jgi:4-amino-4-deoxy-L-arabinose transferase-like glycosyltransferase